MRAPQGERRNPANAPRRRGVVLTTEEMVPSWKSSTVILVRMEWSALGCSCVANLEAVVNSYNAEEV